MTIGLSGYGYWGKKLYRNLAGIVTPSQIAVCDPDTSALTDLLPGTVTYSDNDSLLQHQGLNCVVIATPVNTHSQIAKNALSKGIHVLLEKPATASLSELKELISIADKNHLLIGVDHTFLYADEIARMKETISRPEFGQLKEYHSTRSIFGKFNRDVNVIWDLATHDFSILYTLQPEMPEWVRTTAIFNKNSVAETAFIHLSYRSGFTAFITCSWTFPEKERKIILTGSKQQLMYKGGDLLLYTNENGVNTQTESTLNVREEKPKTILYNREETLSTVLSDFINSVQTNKKMKSDTESAIFVMKILEACNQSLLNNNQQIFIN